MLLPLLLFVLLETCLRLGGYGYDPHFFKRLQIGGEDFFVQNDDFSFNFFPPETVRSPGPVRMPVSKAPGTFRIFVFGESAAMGDPKPAFGAYRYLEMLLRAKYPDKKFEIVNVAFTAIDSHVIVPIARECSGHEGDLWIVYMGNNEMVGPYGAATVFGWRAPPWPAVRLVTGLQRTRTGQWLMAMSRKLQGHEDKTTAWNGMQMFTNNQIVPDSPLKETVYRNFEKNLDDIVRAGTGSGATVLLNTVAVNLKDCPPFASLNGLHVPVADRAQFARLFADGCGLENASNFTAAASVFEQASKLDPEYADLQFRWGQCLLAQQLLDEAHTHFLLAADNDALPFRADTRINQIIRDEQKKISDKHLVLFDAAAALAAGTAERVCGDETFYEHVHFNFDGDYRLSLAWAKQIASLFPANTNAWISQPVCEQMLGLWEWNRALVIEHMLARMQQAPLSSQPNNPSRMAQLQRRLEELRQVMNPETAALTREAFLNQLARAPDDHYLRESFALFLMAVGDQSGALKEWQRIQEEMPQDVVPYFQIGRLLGSQNRLNESEASLRHALDMRPTLTEAWGVLGNVMAMQGKLEPALKCYSTALKQNPQDWENHFRSGKMLGQLNRHAEAMEEYRTAIRLNPVDWQAHYELGGELDASGQLDAARTEFGEAARLDSSNARAHLNYGVVLAKQNHLDEALGEFERAAELDPSFTLAQEYISKVQAMKRRAR